MRARGTKNAIVAVLVGVLAAGVSSSTAHAQSPRRSDPTPPTPSKHSKPLTSSQILTPNAAPILIVNHKSQKALQPSGGSTATGARIVQQDRTGSATQQWQLFGSLNNTNIGNIGSGKFMGIDGGSTSPGAAAIQAPFANNANQFWTLTFRGTTDTFELHNNKSHLCLGISGASTANGALAAQFPCDGSLNQGWDAFG